MHLPVLHRSRRRAGYRRVLHQLKPQSHALVTVERLPSRRVIHTDILAVCPGDGHQAIRLDDGPLIGLVAYHGIPVPASIGLACIPTIGIAHLPLTCSAHLEVDGARIGI